MMDVMDDEVEKLESLLRRSNEDIRKYRNAAENLENSQLKAFFEQKTRERKAFTDELEIGIKALYQKENKGLKDYSGKSDENSVSFFSGNEDEVVKQALQNEETALKKIEHIIKGKDLPSSLVNKLRQQQQNIEGSINCIKMYEQMFD